MVIMDVGLLLLVRGLYRCVWECLVIPFSGGTKTTEGPENSQFTLMRKSSGGGRVAPRVACFYECPG